MLSTRLYAGLGKSSGTCNHSALSYFLLGYFVGMTRPGEGARTCNHLASSSLLHCFDVRATQRNKTRSVTKHNDYMSRLVAGTSRTYSVTIWHMTKQTDYMSRRICWDMTYLLHWVHAGMGLIILSMLAITKVPLIAVKRLSVWSKVLKIPCCPRGEFFFLN